MNIFRYATEQIQVFRIKDFECKITPTVMFGNLLCVFLDCLCCYFRPYFGNLPLVVLFPAV